MYFAERGRRPHRASIVRPHRKIGRGLDVWPVAMRIAGTRNEVRVRVGRSRDAFWLCPLKGGNPQPSLFTLHAPYSLLLATVFLPLLVAVWQNKITARYNIVEEGTAGVE